MSYILAIDGGSSGIRAVLFDKQGNIVAREYEKTPALYPKTGYIENDPNHLWESLLMVCQSIDYWKDLEELERIHSNLAPKIFQPQMDKLKRQEKIVSWKKALNAILSVE